jgi:GTPase Era involved in 16S rRNA processing
MNISRRLFVVLLANNDHGKSTLMNALVSQGLGAASPGRKGARSLVSPWGREIDAYVFVRSYQETEKSEHGSVVNALDANDPSWRERELIIFPSHRSHSSSDLDEMIEAAHSGGFDAICATLIVDGTDERDRIENAWRKNWDERWTLPNPQTEHWREQVEAIGRDLWTWICRALAS